MNPLTDAATLMELLNAWVQRQWLRELDYALTRFLWLEAPDASPELLLAIALTSHQLGRGHVCLDLKATLDDPYFVLSLPPEQRRDKDFDVVTLPSEVLTGLSLANWISKIKHPDLVNEGIGQSPLVLDGARLYLRRYWHYERSVESALEQRLNLSTSICQSLPHVDCQNTLTALFPTDTHSSTNWQKIACALAARSAFCVITGGPGTGKTTTVVKLLALLQVIALNQDQMRPLRIRLAAPTGKAAARLKESIADKIKDLPDAIGLQTGLREAIPTEVITLHRLLGTRPNTRHFKHHARNPLALDVLVVDEASMVDLEMMSALLSALPEHARLILLGDKDQLASVEAGSVLGQLCSRAKDANFTSETAAWINAVTGETLDAELINANGLALDQHIVMLRESYRFTAKSGIGQLAAAVNAGDAAQINHVLQRGYADLLRQSLKTLEDTAFTTLVLGQANHPALGYAHYLAVIKAQRPAIHAPKSDFDSWANTVLAAHSQFQILSALRNGAYGVEGLNLHVLSILKKAQLVHATTSWYEGRPVLVTRNDYSLGLMNGDIGITLNFPQRDKQTGQLVWVLRVAFPKGDGKNGIHWILPSRLQSVETVFALTVHKSQGSEFAHVALILPPTLNPVLTREWVYTGITRAKTFFSLVSVGNDRMIHQASHRTVLRSGGLFLNENVDKNIS